MEERKDEPVEGHRRLAFEVLSRALDDICPVEEPGDQLRDPQEREAFMREQLERIKIRVQKHQMDEAELDREWRQLETQSRIKYEKFKAERDATFDRIRATLNTPRIAVGVSRYESYKQARINAVTLRINREKSAYLEKIKKLRSRGDAIPNSEVDSKIRTLDKTLAGRVKAITERYDGFIRNLLRTDNTATVERRIEASRLVWKRREQELIEKWRVREANHNSKRQELDPVRLALDWFIADVEKVKLWCDIARVPLIQCYEGVKRRLDLINRHSEEFDRTLRRVKAGEFSEAYWQFRKLS